MPDMRFLRKLFRLIVILGVVVLMVPCGEEPQLSAGQGQQGGQINWPRFRGPASNPISDNPTLPVHWSKTENVEWVSDVPGVGWSSPVVWGKRIFVTAATSRQPMKQPKLGTDFSNEYLAELQKQGLSAEEINRRLYERDREMPHELEISLVLFCYDLESGKRSWERQVYHGNPRGGRHSKNSYASETPVTDGKRVYVYFTDYGLYAYDFSGKQVWATPLERHDTWRDWGTGASPALYRDRLFVQNDNEQQPFLAAFDTRTGKELWRKPRNLGVSRKTGWSTPFVWENRVRAEVVAVGPGAVISYGLDGAELWRMKRMALGTIQSPFACNDLLYVTSGTPGESNRPIAAIRAGGSGDITPAEPDNRNEYVVWYDRTAGGTYLPTPVVYGNALYAVTDKGIISRHNAATGERTYRSRISAEASAFTASPWAYNGRVFVLSEEGDTFVIDTKEEFKLLGVNSLGEFSMATPAIIGDRLLIRTQSHLYSIRNRHKQDHAVRDGR